MADTTRSVDLTNCQDREPIHTPGSIQPHGALLAFDDGLTSVQRCSDNAAELLGFGNEKLIGRTLHDVCTRATAHDIRNALTQARNSSKPGLLLGGQLL